MNNENNMNYYGNDYNNYYDENQNYEYNNSSKGSNLGLLLKIFIIIICIIALIWLIIKLKSNNNDTVVYNDDVHISNVEKVRLAGERYFFIDENLPKGTDKKMVELKTLIKKGYVGDIVDANQKVCNDLKSVLTLQNDGTRYVLVIKLSCSTNEKEEIFYYQQDNFACLNCNGSTLMDGKTKNYADEKEPEKEASNYSCTTWSDWSDQKENDASLDERTRIVVLGVKKGNSNTCEVWSEYTTSPVNTGVNGISEVKETVETVWSGNKTSRTPVQNSETIKVISVNTVHGSSYSKCPSGYSNYGDQCISDSTTTSDLSFDDYNSGKYNIVNAPCNSVDTEKGADGKYHIVYKGCQIKDVTSKETSYSSGYTEYTYQELENKKTKQYRYCVKLATTNDEYTKEYYEEANLPQGFEKAPGSEKTQYSYKLKVCEK